MRRHCERGAAAVEMALVLPVLILLVLGITEFGRAYNAQVTLTNAAREGVRVMAISKDPALAKARAVSASSTLHPPLPLGNVSASACSAAAATSLPPQTTVTITYQLSTLTGIAGPFTLKATGVMTCGG
ncbi:pilus assembly protein [Arthrobacter cheniae]|uniref:Pilus assembly protein n=1 Tax=Arthrobacter cheniae TaxID=1258888 RepID=A0A3A5M5F7_9MICC|nr:TadE family protein [Arthrobacter cheniae]RJT82950.1 pilus assembly protein [Arthrobacter cheniae]